MSALEFYDDNGLVKSINLGDPRSYSSIALDFGSTRTPSAVSCTFVIASISMADTDGQTSTITAQLDSGGGFVTIATSSNTFSLTGLGIGGTATIKVPMTFIVPVGATYKLVSTGTGTNSITSIYELVL